MQYLLRTAEDDDADWCPTSGGEQATFFSPRFKQTANCLRLPVSACNFTTALRPALL